MELSETFAAEIEVDILQGCLEGWLNPDVFDHFSPAVRTLIKNPDLVFPALRSGQELPEEAKKVLLYALGANYSVLDVYDCLEHKYLTPEEAHPAAVKILANFPKEAAGFYLRNVISKEELLHYFRIVANKDIHRAIWFHTGKQVITLEELKPFLIEAAKNDKFEAYSFVEKQLLTIEEFNELFPS